MSDKTLHFFTVWTTNMSHTELDQVSMEERNRCHTFFIKKLFQKVALCVTKVLILVDNLIQETNLALLTPLQWKQQMDIVLMFDFS